MLEYLVEEHGFDVFAIEAIFSESLAVNDYVLHGKGTAAESLAGMYFWVWDTEEVIALIEWMRAYNADEKHTRKLRFYGVDMQFTPAASRELLGYLKRVDSRLATKHGALWEVLDDKEWGRVQRKSSPSAAKRVEAALEETAQVMDHNRDAWIAKTDQRSFVFARQHLRIIQQAAEQYRPGSSVSFFARDRAMAQNVQWILDNEPKGTRVVLWAHNGHIQESSSGVKMMGAHLAKALGDAYVTFGFAFNQGSFQVRDSTLPKPMGVTEVTVKPEPVGSMGHTYARVGLPLFAIDLKRAVQDPVLAAWFSKPRLRRDLGSVYGGDDAVTYAFRVVNDFDAMFFVERTTRARPTATGRRAPGK